MKNTHIPALACLVVFMLAISSCGQKDQPSPILNGTYIGTSTPLSDPAYPDTVTIRGGAPYVQVNVQRSFHTNSYYYSFYLPGTVSGNNLTITDTTIYFSPSPTTYSTKGSLNDTVLTLNDAFTYTGGSRGTSTFVGVMH